MVVRHSSIIILNIAAMFNHLQVKRDCISRDQGAIERRLYRFPFTILRLGTIMQTADICLRYSIYGGILLL